MAADHGTTQTLSTGGAPEERRPARRGLQPLPDAPASGPLGVGQSLDLAIDVLRAHFLTCLLIAFPLWLPVNAMSRLAYHLDEQWQALALLPGLFGSFLVQALTVALVTVIVYGHIQGHRVPARKALGIGLKRAPALILATIITSLGASVGTMCCLIPGILLTWLWQVTPAALVLERLKPIEAISRSAKLVRGSFWRWAGLFLTMSVVVMPMTLPSGILGDPNVRAWLMPELPIPVALFDAIDLLLSAVLMGIATAFSAVVLTVFYIDLRTRAEGFDLFMELDRMREGAQPAAATLPAGGAA